MIDASSGAVPAMTYEQSVREWARRQLGFQIPDGARDVGIEGCAGGEHDHHRTFVTFLTKAVSAGQIQYEIPFSKAILEVWEIGHVSGDSGSNSEASAHSQSTIPPKLGTDEPVAVYEGPTLVETTVNKLFLLAGKHPEEWEVLDDGSWRELLSADARKVVLGKGVPQCGARKELSWDIATYFLVARRTPAPTEATGEEDLEEPDEPCQRCGQYPAAGFATINGRRYCHGDEDDSLTCYEQTSIRGEYVHHQRLLLRPSVALHNDNSEEPKTLEEPEEPSDEGH
jgi:hypothetical protein